MFPAHPIPGIFFRSVITGFPSAERRGVIPEPKVLRIIRYVTPVCLSTTSSYINNYNAIYLISIAYFCNFIVK